MAIVNYGTNNLKGTATALEWRLVSALAELLVTTELNMDDMEDHTREMIEDAEEAVKLFEKTYNCSVGALAI